MNRVVLTYVKEVMPDDAGHGLDHVERVTRLADLFAKKEEASRPIVFLAAALHDVDDYKLFGAEQAENLINANLILDKIGVDSQTKEEVLAIIASMGYNKYLKGVRPNTLEGKVVSDADMCDALGSMGILRTYSYGASRGLPFFDKRIKPVRSSLSAEMYKDCKNEHSVQHFFDKLLLLPAIMMTESGKAEGIKRQKIMVDFLRSLFLEEGADEWILYLEEFYERVNDKRGYY